MRSFRSITVLRKRSERRVLRHGPPARLAPISPRREIGSPAGETLSSCFCPRRSGQNPRLRHCEAGAHTGCGNPFSPSKPRLSSKRGESNGGGAPLVVGEGVQRGPPRNRSPLAVSFPRFFSAKRNGVAPQREKPSSCFRPRRSGQFSGLLRIRRSPVLFVPPVPSPPAAYFLDAQIYNASATRIKKQ